MPARYEDWMRQAQGDLAHAEHSVTMGDFSWACFAAQQAAEKAVKALYQKLGAEAWGHAVSGLLDELPLAQQPDDQLIDQAKELDKYYIAPRYPNSYPEGAPVDYYTKAEAERAVTYARRIIQFCQDRLL